MFSTRKRKHSKEHLATQGKRYHNLRFIILTNRNSASASEVLSAFLRDYNLALLFGEKSFGKGSMQQVIKLSDEGTLRLTVAHWVSPGDYVIHGKG